MALSEEYLAEMRERLGEVKAQTEQLMKAVPEMVEMQELLLEEISEMHNALSEVYSYSVTYENEAKEMRNRLEKILKVSSKALDLPTYDDFK